MANTLKDSLRDYLKENLEVQRHHLERSEYGIVTINDCLDDIMEIIGKFINDKLE